MLLSISFGPPAFADTCVPVPQTVAPARIAALSRGFNADGWINGEVPSRELLQQLRRAGMSHVRLPVPAERVMPRFTSKVERDETLAVLDKALKQLTALGYAISVDLHPGERFNRLHKEDPDAALSEMQEAWGGLAGIMRSYPADRIFAELLNEPDVDADTWQRQAETLAGFVRKLLPTTTLIVGPVNWQRADSLPRFRSLDDPDVVYAIHFYDPMVFTHQGHWDAQDRSTPAIPRFAQSARICRRGARPRRSACSIPRLPPQGTDRAPIGGSRPRCNGSGSSRGRSSSTNSAC
jgi:endoglucanase